MKMRMVSSVAFGVFAIVVSVISMCRYSKADGIEAAFDLYGTSFEHVFTPSGSGSLSAFYNDGPWSYHLADLDLYSAEMCAYLPIPEDIEAWVAIGHEDPEDFDDLQITLGFGTMDDDDCVPVVGSRMHFYADTFDDCDSPDEPNIDISEAYWQGDWNKLGIKMWSGMCDGRPCISFQAKSDNDTVTYQNAQLVWPGLTTLVYQSIDCLYVEVVPKDSTPEGDMQLWIDRFSE